jgi:hypothetical protein
MAIIKTLCLVFISFILYNPDIFAQNLILIPPVENGPVKVTATVAIININEIDAATQTLTANVFFRVKWKDPRLAHQGPQYVIRPLNEIWNPNLAIVNRQSMTITMPDNAEIYRDGTVIYRQRVFGQFSQNMDFSNFPFDRHKLIIRLASTGNSPDKIEFTEDSTQKSVISNELTILDWKIQEYNIINSPYSVVPGTAPVASFAFEFSAERNSSYYFLNFFLPLVMIILMSMAVFWLEANMVAPQISVATTSMLTLIAYRFMIAGSLPKISYLTRMDLFIFCSTILIFLTLAEAIITSVFSAQGKEKPARIIDLYSRWIFPLVYIIIYIIAFVL